MNVVVIVCGAKETQTWNEAGLFTMKQRQDFDNRRIFSWQIQGCDTDRSTDKSLHGENSLCVTHSYTQIPAQRKTNR